MVQLRIKELAEERNLNMSQLQKATQLDLGLIRRYWYNDTSMVRLDALTVFAAFFGVTVGDLFATE